MWLKIKNDQSFLRLDLLLKTHCLETFEAFDHLLQPWIGPSYA